jgi:hypothetical protein
MLAYLYLLGFISKTMPKVKNFFLSNSAVICAIACLVVYFTFIQFITTTFYDPDSYYHAAVTNFIKNSGFRYQFHWTQFSLFKDFFSDKDFLFHLLALPFFYLTDNLVTAGKYATIFYNVLFILVYAFILRKYLSDFLAALFLLLPALSSTFIAFFSQFRSVTLSNILTLLGIYFMINKRLLGVFIISLLYPLAHISFFMLIPFVLICEIIRYAVNKEFSLRNLYTVLIGMLLGMFIHPNFPNNFLSFHLNGILVPFYTITKVKMDFGGEFNSPLSSFAFINNFTVFFIFNFILWMSFFVKKKCGFSTLVWLGCSNIYLVLSIFSNRYWYPANILFYVFFASYVRDIIEGVEWKKIFSKVGLFIVLYLAATLIIFPMNLNRVGEYIYFFNANNIHYTNAAAWMKRYIPAGETVYHASWSDSPYFICLNPKNNYLTVLDPIYMFYRYPKEFSLYQNLIWGKIEKPYEPIREVFKANYGYTRKETPLYFQIIQDPKHYKIVYEDGIGIIFKLI